MLLSNGTILSGDAVKVGESGSVLLSLTPGGRAVLAEETHVRFSSANGDIVAQLLSGALAVDKEDKDPIVVKTSRYNVESQGGGRTEFLVALLPDEKTIVEAQHGKVAITETRSGESYTLAEGHRAEIPASAEGFPGQQQVSSVVIGKVVAAAGATRNGNPLSSGGSILDGDTVSTGASGRAVILLSTANQITLNENTSASFTRPVERDWLQLQKGTIVIVNASENRVLVTTTRFHIEPSSTAPTTIKVGLMADNSTYIISVAGDVAINPIPSEQSYLLPAGHSTLIPANASAPSGLQLLAETEGPTPKPSTPPPPAPSVSKSHSHETIIIVAIAGGAGIAAGLAAISAKGSGGSQPISPSAP
jgi:ferric-dicitrate binding protein FerR (iron transport regulator)